MAPRNPSELQRLEEERQHLLGCLCSTHYTKEPKERMLRELRKIEETLEIESVPYNSTKFCEQL